MTTRQLFTLASLAVLLLAAATGCTDDHSDANEPAQTGLPVDFASIRIAASANGGSGNAGGTATDPGGFYPGDIIHARLVHNTTMQKAVLTNIGTAGTPKWKADKTVYWQSTTTGHTLTLSRGSEGDFTLPDDMNETTYVQVPGSTVPGSSIPNYTLHDRLFYTRTGPMTATPIDYTLKHCMAQIVVTLKRDPASKLPTDDDLRAARVSMELPFEGYFDGTTGDVTQRNTGTAAGAKTVKFLKGGEQTGVHSHFAVALPGDTHTKVITITIPAGNSSTGNEQKYQYTATDPITLEAGNSRVFHLSLGARVSAISIDAKDWQKVGQGPGVGEWLIIKDVTSGSLKDRLSKAPKDYKHISVRGELNGDDYTALNTFLKDLPSSYVSLEIQITGGSTSIPEHAFLDCTKLGAVALKGIKEIGPGAFRNSSLTSITLPEGLTRINLNAFSLCQGLKSITLPRSVTFLGWSAFHSCTNLASVSLPEGLKEIGGGAFNGCTSLKSIDLPSSVTTWGTSIFNNSGLTSIVLPEGMTEIPGDTFQDCGSLQTITLHSKITAVGEYAFLRSGLTSIILPEGLEKIGDSAFSSCTSLKSIDLPPSVTTWGTSIFNNSGLTSIVLPEGMTTIPNNTFDGCGSLQTITLPSTIIAVGDYAFLKSGLTSIILPEKLTTIGDQAFYNCTKLQKVAAYKSPGIKVGTNAFLHTPTDKLLFDYGISGEDSISGSILGTDWQTIYYDYKGSGDKLAPGSYSSSKQLTP